MSETTKNRDYYIEFFKDYPDVVTLKQLREMLGGIGEGTALKLMQENKIPHYKIKCHYHIPKQCIIDYILSNEYEEYKKILKHKI